MNKQFKILKEYEQNLMMIEDLIGASTTNNFQIYKICRLLFDSRFLTCSTSDDWPKYVFNNQMFILNVDDSSKNGSHWCAFYKYLGKFYAYDSYNRNVKHLSKWWRNKNIISANTDRDQSYNNENNCGARCISWLIMFDKYKTKIINII